MTVTETIIEESAAITAGSHFWCETHLCAIPVADRSPDPRYCRQCYDFLLEEARRLETRHGTRLPPWVPVQQDIDPVTTENALSFDGSQDVTAPGYTRARPAVPEKPVSDLGEAIEPLANQGMSSRQIAAQLGLQGFSVSHMTVVRHLKRRVQV